MRIKALLCAASLATASVIIEGDQSHDLVPDDPPIIEPFNPLEGPYMNSLMSTTLYEEETTQICVTYYDFDDHDDDRYSLRVYLSYKKEDYGYYSWRSNDEKDDKKDEITFDESEIIYKSHKSSDLMQCFDIYVPANSDKKNSVKFRLTDSQSDEELTMQSKVEIKASPIGVFLVTDKPIYLPTQQIQYRVVVLDRNVRPVQQKDMIQKITIEDPEGSVVYQTKNPELNDYGHFEDSYTLLTNPILGKWRLKVKTASESKSNYETEFKVDKYVLPKFSAEMKNERPAGKFQYQDEEDELEYKVCAQYTHGARFKGTVNYKLSVIEDVCKQRYRYDYSYVDYDYATPPPMPLSYVDKNGKTVIIATPEPVLPTTELTGKGIELDKTGCATIKIKPYEITHHLVNNRTTSCYWNYQAAKLNFNATIFEANTDEEATETDSSIEINFRTLKVTNPHRNSVIEYDDQESTIVRATVRNLDGSPVANRQVFIDYLWGSSHYDDHVDPNKTPEEHSSNNAYGYGIHNHTHKTDMDGNVSFKVVFNARNTGWNDYDDVMEIRENIYQHKFGLWLFVKEAGEMYGTTVGMADRRKLLEEKEAQQEADQDNFDEDDDDSAKVTLTCNSGKVYLLDSRISEFDLKKWSKTNSVEISIATFFAAVKVNEKIVYQTKLDSNRKLNEKYELPASILNKLGSKDAKYEVLVYAEINDDTDMTAEKTKEVSKFDLKIDDSCSVSAEMEIPELAKPGQAVDIVIKFDGPLVDDRTKSQCSVSFVDESVQIYAEKNSLENNEITQKIIKEQILDYIRSAGNYYCDRSFAGGYVVATSKKELKKEVPCIYPIMEMSDNIEYMSYDYAGEVMAESAPMLGKIQGEYRPRSNPEPMVKVRNFMPETWMFESHQIEGHQLTIATKTPDTMTSWLASSYCLGESFALTLTQPKKITVVKKFFTELKTPYAATRTEVVSIPVQLFNAGSNTEEAFMAVDYDEEMLILVDPSPHRDFTIEAKDVHTEWFKFRVVGIGSTKIVATAASKSTRGLNDAMEKTFKLKAEGIAKQASFTSFKCVNRNSNFMAFKELQSSPPPGADVVDDSVRVQLSLTDNLFGSAMDNLDSLVTVPYGCGEQNMVGVVPNIAVANFLPENDPIRSNAIKNAQHGYIRELNYQREDGSFSAFGNNDSEGSSWLTAFVVRVFMEGKDYIEMDYEKNIKPAVDWLLKNSEVVKFGQVSTKKFPLVGRLFHPLFQEQEGVYTDIHMTVTALMAFERVLEAETLTKKESSRLRNTIILGWEFIQKSAQKACRESKKKSCTWETGMNVPIYVLGHVLYGAKVSDKKFLVGKLKKYFNSQKTNEKNMIYWKAKPDAKPCQGYWDCYYHASNDVELTSYVLLATLPEDNITRQNRLTMRYLQSKRNVRGGWPSTQDTMMAMTALSVFAQRMGSSNSKDMNVQFNIGGQTKKTEINSENTGLVQIFEAPRNEEITQVTVSGKGCVLAQTTVFYNIKEIEEDLNLELSFDAANEEYCVQRLHPAEETLMAVVEIQLPTGYTANQYSLDALMKNSGGWVLRYDDNDDNVSVYLDKIGHVKQCFTLRLNEDNSIEVENPQKRSVVVYDYYNTSVRRSIMV